MRQTDTSVFKKYDIRGIYPGQIDEEFAYRLGRSYGHFLQKQNSQKKLTVIVSRDMRLSSAKLSQNLTKGLLDQGLNVVDIGLCSTPTFYFAVAFYSYHGGIQITASHNPKEFNGFKLVRSNARPISGDTGLEDIKNIFQRNRFSSPPAPGVIKHQKNILADLITSGQKEWGIKPSKIKALKIVVDAANSMGAPDFTGFFSVLPGQLIPLNFQLDGTFPAHEADPLKPENMVDLQKAIIDNQADLGIATDGDGDRIFFVDEKGRLIPQEILRGLMAQIVLKLHPHHPVCYDIRPGRITKDLIKQAGGQAIVTKVGHSLIKEQMIAKNSYFSGESSGHFFFKFSYGSFESPFVFVAKFLQYISDRNQPVSHLIDPHRIYFHSGEINSQVSDSQAKIAQIKTTYADAKISLLDGITVEYPDWWFNVRASNTEPKIRLNLEAKTKALMEQKRDQVLKLIRS